MPVKPKSTFNAGRWKQLVGRPPADATYVAPNPRTRLYKPDEEMDFAKAWTMDWLKKRSDILQENHSSYDRFSHTKLNNQLHNIASVRNGGSQVGEEHYKDVLEKYQNHPSFKNDPEGYARTTLNMATASYDAIKHKIYTPDGIDKRDKSIYIHEVAHAAHPSPQVYKINKINNGKWIWDKKEPMMDGVKKDDYLDNPDEIYSRLMQFRYQNKLNPAQRYNGDWVKKARERMEFDSKTEYIEDYYKNLKKTQKKFNDDNYKKEWLDKELKETEPLYRHYQQNYKRISTYPKVEDFNLFERYNDATMEQLLNDVAQNTGKTSRASQWYAKPLEA